jgi:hypothetical protein
MSMVQKWMDTVCRALRICVDVIHLEGLITKAFDTEGGFPLHICNFFLRICKLACGRRLLLLVEPSSLDLFKITTGFNERLCKDA